MNQINIIIKNFILIVLVILLFLGLILAGGSWLIAIGVFIYEVMRTDYSLFHILIDSILAFIFSIVIGLILIFSTSTLGNYFD